MDHIPDIFGQLPKAASTLAPSVDWLFQFIFWISVVMFVLIVGTMLFFVAKYRAKPGQKPTAPGGSHLTLELFWTFAPLLLLVMLFHWGFKSYVFAAVAPAGALEFRVRAKKWNWEFEYPSGTREGSLLVVPVHQPIKLIMSSDDVLHSFYVPEFRVKRDIVPGMYSTLWFEATEVGEYQVYCTEYCGTSHSGMLAKVRVVTPEQYRIFLRDQDRPPPGKTQAEWGEQLFASNSCTTCHHLQAGQAPGVGPNLRGIIGTQQPLEGGGAVLADLAYVRESILRPQAKIVRGYGNAQMSAYVLADSRIEAIYAYLETLH